MKPSTQFVLSTESARQKDCSSFGFLLFLFFLFLFFFAAKICTERKHLMCQLWQCHLIVIFQSYTYIHMCLESGAKCLILWSVHGFWFDYCLAPGTSSKCCKQKLEIQLDDALCIWKCELLNWLQTYYCASQSASKLWARVSKKDVP